LTTKPEFARICFLAACYVIDDDQAKRWLPAAECGLRESLVKMCKQHGVDASDVPPCAKRAAIDV